jgi:hypothetical protein
MTEAHERYEPGGVSTWWVLAFAAGFLILLAASVGGLYAVFVSVVPADHTPVVRQFPQPRQEAHPSQELHALLGRQREELSGYRWADPDHTFAAIPIERAMQIIAARGADAFGPIESGPPAPPPAQGAPP